MSPNSAIWTYILRALLILTCHHTATTEVPQHIITYIELSYPFTRILYNPQLSSTLPGIIISHKPPHLWWGGCGFWYVVSSSFRNRLRASRYPLLPLDSSVFLWLSVKTVARRLDCDFQIILDLSISTTESSTSGYYYCRVMQHCTALKLQTQPSRLRSHRSKSVCVVVQETEGL